MITQPPMLIINPATEEIISEVEEDSEDSLFQKFQVLHSHQDSWKKTPLDERVKILKRFAALMDRDIERLAKILTEEVGKPLQQSRNEINGGRRRIKWLTENAVKYLAPETMDLQDGLEEKIVYEPLGVV